MILNLFRLAGDVSHLLSYLFIFLQLRVRKSSAGISLKTMELYLLVFLCRYLDIVDTLPRLIFDPSFLMLYNLVLKLVYLYLTYRICHMMRSEDPYRCTYDREHDSFAYVRYLVAPCAVLAVFFNNHNSLLMWLVGVEKVFTFWHLLTDYFWAFSIFLESVAIFPQLVLLQRYQEIENITSNFVVALGLYRFFYILNWIVRFFGEGYVRWIVWIPGLVQTVLYADFIYYYVMSKLHGTKMSLPL